MKSMIWIQSISQYSVYFSLFSLFRRTLLSVVHFWSLVSLAAIGDINTICCVGRSPDIDYGGHWILDRKVTNPWKYVKVAVRDVFSWLISSSSHLITIKIHKISTKINYRCVKMKVCISRGALTRLAVCPALSTTTTRNVTCVHLIHYAWRCTTTQQTILMLETPWNVVYNLFVWATKNIMQLSLVFR